MSEIDKYMATDPEFREVVVVYILDELEGKILLVERVDPKSGLGKGKVSGVGGGREENETVDETLRREVKEETGIDILTYENMGNVVWLFPEKPAYNQKAEIFVCKNYQGQAQYMPGEAVKPIWFDLKEIPYEKMFEDNKYFVPLVLEGKKVSCMFLYQDDKVVEKRVDIL